MRLKKAVIILPTYNEKKNVDQLISQVFAAIETIEQWNIEVLVVDSNSPDGTAELVKKLQKKYRSLYLLETPKEGLGKAYIRGFEYAINQMNAFLVFEMDADLSHDPNLLPQFIEKIQSGADFVIGSRYTKGGSIPNNWGWHRKLFSVLGNWIVRLGFMRFKITDWTSGYRAIKSWLITSSLDNIRNYSGYVFQVAILDHAVSQKANIQEIPLKFVDRIEGVSKMQSTQYILQTLLYVFTKSPFVKFVIVGGIGFLIDIGLFYYFHTLRNFPTWQSNLISTETALLSNFMLNNFWSFAHKKVDHSPFSYIKGFLKFNLVSSGSILIQIIGMEIAKMLFGPTDVLIYKVIIIVFLVIPYSYFFYNKFIWKD